MLQDIIENELHKLIKEKGDKKKVNLLKYIVSIFDRRHNLNVKLEDKEVISIIEKYINNEKEMMKYKPNEKEIIQDDIDYLSHFLPKKLSDEEIKKLVLDIIPDIKNIQFSERIKKMGIIMKEVAGRANGNDIKRILLGI